MNQQRQPGQPGPMFGQGVPPHAGAPRPGMGTARIVLNVVGGLVLVFLAIVGFLVVVGRGRGDAAAGGDRPAVGAFAGSAENRAAAPVDRRGIGELVESKVRGPEVLVDEEVAVGADGWQARGFTLPGARPVEVIAEGRTHADKGFTVYVMSAENYASFQNHEAFKHVPSFQGMKVRSFGKTDTLPPGSWYVVVQNSENIFNSMVVHLRIVVDPS